MGVKTTPQTRYIIPVCMSILAIPLFTCNLVNELKLTNRRLLENRCTYMVHCFFANNILLVKAILQFYVLLLVSKEIVFLVTRNHICYTS